MPPQRDTRDVEFSAFAGKLTDPSHEGNVRRFAKFDGMDAMPSSEDRLVAPAESPDGYDLLNFCPLTRNPDGPARPPEEMGEAVDRRGTLTLLAARVPGISGNIFCTVREGDSNSGPLATTLAAGREGEIPHVYPELWNTPPVPLVSRNMSEAGDGTPPDESEQPDPPPPDEGDDDPIVAFVVVAIQREDGGNLVPEWDVWIINLGEVALDYTAGALLPVTGGQGDGEFAFTPTAPLTVPTIVDIGITDPDDFLDPAWLAANAVNAGVVTVPSPPAGQVVSAQVRITCEYDDTPANEYASMTWYQPLDEGEGFYDTRVAWWPEWDGVPMVQSEGVVTAAQALSQLGGTTPVGGGPPYTAMEIGWAKNNFGFSSSLKGPIEAAANILWSNVNVAQNPFYQLHIDVAEQFLADVISDKANYELSYHVPSPEFPPLPSPSGITGYDAAFQVWEGLRAIAVFDPNVPTVAGNPKLSDLAPFFYKVKVRRDHGPLLYKVRIQNKGNRTIKIEEMTVRAMRTRGYSIPNTEWHDATAIGAANVNIEGVGGNIQPGLKGDITVNMDPSMIPGVLQNGIIPSLAARPYVVEENDDDDGPAFYRYFSPAVNKPIYGHMVYPLFAVLTIKIAEGNNIRTIEIPMQWPWNGFGDWVPEQMGYSESDEVYVFLPCPKDRVIDWAFGQPVFYPDPFLFGNASVHDEDLHMWWGDALVNARSFLDGAKMSPSLVVTYFAKKNVISSNWNPGMYAGLARLVTEDMKGFYFGPGEHRGSNIFNGTSMFSGEIMNLPPNPFSGVVLNSLFTIADLPP